MRDLSSRVSRQALVASLERLTGRKDVRILEDFRVKRASTGVEGFASLVLRVEVSYRLPEDEKIYSHVFIVKCMPQTEYQRDFAKTTGIFSKEWLFFSEVMPLLVRASAGRVDVPLPICYHGVCDSDDTQFYMEDLVASGYRAVNRSFLMDGLDYEHCRVVMRALGRLHSLTLAAEQTLDPMSGGWIGSFPDLNREKVYYLPGPGEPPASAKGMIDNMLQNFKEMCKEIEGFPKMAVASGALDRVLAGVYPTICRLRRCPPRNRCVLTHGDCWMNNMMFRYGRGEMEQDVPTDVKFFDLQLSKLCHPSTDLLYFLCQSTRRPVREKYFTALIEEYHKSFAEALKALTGDEPPFSLQEFVADVEGEYKPYGLIFGVLYSPLQMLGDDFLLPNAEDLTDENVIEFFSTTCTQKVKHRFVNDSLYRSHIEEIVRDFLDMALPDGLESVESSPLLAKE